MKSRILGIFVSQLSLVQSVWQWRPFWLSSAPLGLLCRRLVAHCNCNTYSILWVTLQNTYCFYLNYAFYTFLIFFCSAFFSIWLAHAQYQFIYFFLVQIHSVDKVFKCSSYLMGNFTNSMHHAFFLIPASFPPFLFTFTSKIASSPMVVFFLFVFFLFFDPPLLPRLLLFLPFCFSNQALSGDSSVNPALGRLVLQCLCPALHGLLCDGLKPHQSDLITGRRPNSTWGLVQASTKPGMN